VRQQQQHLPAPWGRIEMLPLVRSAHTAVQFQRPPHMQPAPREAAYAGPQLVTMPTFAACPCPCQSLSSTMFLCERGHRSLPCAGGLPRPRSCPLSHPRLPCRGSLSHMPQCCSAASACAQA
jgi:hypothetical protein